MAVEIEMSPWVPVPPEEAFRWWTDPARLARWFAPRGSSVLSARAEARVGGAWEVVFGSGEGIVTESGIYREIDPGWRLRLSLQQVYSDGSAGPARSGPLTEIEVRFRAEGIGTRMEFRQSGIATPAMAAGMNDGWGSCFELMEAAMVEDGAPMVAMP